MKLKKLYRHFHFREIFFAAGYFIIVAAHLFFAPGFQSGIATGHNHNVKKNVELIYNLIRTDRSMFNDNKKSETSAKEHPAVSISLLSNAIPAFANDIGRTPLFLFLADHQLSYLSNRVLRI